MYSSASSSEGVWFTEFSESAKVSSQSDTVLGVSVSDPEVEPSEVWQMFCWQSPGGSSLWYTGSEKLELELQGFLGLVGRGTNCCGRECLITVGKKKNLNVANKRPKLKRFKVTRLMSYSFSNGGEHSVRNLIQPVTKRNPSSHTVYLTGCKRSGCLLGRSGRWCQGE